MLSTLLYGCETWHLKISQEKKLDSFDSKCLRKILGIKWSDFITNEEVRERSRQQPVTDTICKRRLSWLGHAVRLPPSRLANQVLTWHPGGKRLPGKPRMNYRQTVTRDLKLVDRKWDDVLDLAADRTRWSALAASCVTRRGSIWRSA